MGVGHGHGHDHQHEHGHEGEPAPGRGPRVLGQLRQLLRPHSHDAADSVDSALESSARGIRAVKISLLALGVTAALQLVVVAVSGSVALLADTVHNLADALTALPLWLAFALGRRAPTRRYTYGYGRAEDLAGVFIVAVIAVSALVTGWQSVLRLLDPRPVANVGWVVLAGLLGFVGNELVAMYRIRVGRQIGSAALVADGLHARTDGLTSLAVVAGALGVIAGYELADPVVGIVITVAILAVLRSAATDVYRRLMDAVDPDLVAAAERAAGSTEGVQGVEYVRLRWIGHRVHAETGVVVDCDLTVVAAHDLAEDVRHRLLHDVPKLADATVHVSPCDHPGVDHHASTAHHRRSG